MMNMKSGHPEPPIRYRLKTLLFAFFALGLGITVVLNPTQNMHVLVSSVAAVLLVCGLGVAVGNEGKRRIQFASYTLLVILFHLSLKFECPPFADVTTLSQRAIERFTHNTTPQTAPDGTLVYLESDGRYEVRTAGGQFVPASAADLEKSGLIAYAVSDTTIYSSEAMRGIYANVLSMFAGCLGFIISGIAFDQRLTPVDTRARA